MLNSPLHSKQPRSNYHCAYNIAALNRAFHSPEKPNLSSQSSLHPEQLCSNRHCNWRNSVQVTNWSNCGRTTTAFKLCPTFKIIVSRFFLVPSWWVKSQSQCSLKNLRKMSATKISRNFSAHFLVVDLLIVQDAEFLKFVDSWLTASKHEWLHRRDWSPPLL